MQDRYLSCDSCGVRFLWTSAEQTDVQEQPVLCPGCRVLLPASGRQRGVVKFYNTRRGWGFISLATGGEVFFHRSGLATPDLHPLHEGDLVEFAVEETNRGPQGVALERLEATGDPATP